MNQWMDRVMNFSGIFIFYNNIYHKYMYIEKLNKL